MDMLVEGVNVVREFLECVTSPLLALLALALRKGGGGRGRRGGGRSGGRVTLTLFRVEDQAAEENIVGKDVPFVGQHVVVEDEVVVVHVVALVRVYLKIKVWKTWKIGNKFNGSRRFFSRGTKSGHVYNRGLNSIGKREENPTEEDSIKAEVALSKQRQARHPISFDNLNRRILPLDLLVSRRGTVGMLLKQLSRQPSSLRVFFTCINHSTLGHPVRHCHRAVPHKCTQLKDTLGFRKPHQHLLKLTL